MRLWAVSDIYSRCIYLIMEELQRMNGFERAASEYEIVSRRHIYGQFVPAVIAFLLRYCERRECHFVLHHTRLHI